jgi:hypothetical protein
MELPLQRPLSIVVNLSDKSLNSESPLIWCAIRGFLFSAGSFIINEHLLKRFRVEERHGSDLLEFDFAPPHQVVNPIPAYVINLHRFRYALAWAGAAQCNVRRL